MLVIASILNWSVLRFYSLLKDITTDLDRIPVQIAAKILSWMKILLRSYQEFLLITKFILWWKSVMLNYNKNDEQSCSISFSILERYNPLTRVSGLALFPPPLGQNFFMKPWMVSIIHFLLVEFSLIQFVLLLSLIHSLLINSWSRSALLVCPLPIHWCHC